MAAIVVATGAVAFYFVRAESHAATERARLSAEMRDVARLKLELERKQTGLEGPQAPAPAGPLLELGPPSGSRTERERAVLALLQGQVEARRLPVVATEPGAAYDSGLRDRLAPVRYVRGPSPSPSPPSLKCKCRPDDPLCSCL